VIVVSAYTHRDAALTAAALSMGAVDVVAKPADATGSGLLPMAAELRAKLHAVAGRRWRRPPAVPPRPVMAKRAPDREARRVVAVAASTGGPAALAHLLPRLPADLPAAILVVQHMPEGFTTMLAQRLELACGLTVEEARDGEPLREGRVVVARGGRHLEVRRTPHGVVTVLGGGPAVSGHRPSADVLFASVAEEFAGNAVGVVLTGMGEDGALGLLALRHRGADTIAQDEESSVVFGMPRAAILKGAAERVLALERISDAVVATVLRQARRGAAPALAAAGRHGEVP
jgi:two-component system chemotaxis response regulator CheB